MNLSFAGFLSEADEQKLISEAFNSNPYDLTFGKKSAGDIFFTFHDEDDKEFRIQFYTPQGLGKNVRQVFIGTKKGASYLDSQQKFKNPMRVAATMIDATKQFLDTPIGKSIDGFAINFSKKVMDRGIALLPKIIRQSGLKQKLNVMDLKYSPDDSRGFVWVVRKGKDPATVFDGPKMKGITWDDPEKVGDVPVQAPVVPEGTTITVRGRGSYTDVGVDRMGIMVKFLENNSSEILSFSDEAVARFVNDNSGVKASVSLRQSPGSYLGCSVVAMRKLGMSNGQEFVINDSDGRRVADITLMAVRQSNPDEVTDSKWVALLAAMKKSYVGSSVKTLGNTAVGQVVKDGIKMIVGLSRGSETVTMNLDAYGSDSKQITLPISTRRFPDIDVNKPEALSGVINLAIDVAIEIASRDNVSTGAPKIKTGWKNENASNGNPNITCYDGNGIMIGGIGLRFSPVYGQYSGSSKAVGFKEIEGSDVSNLAKTLKLPAVPSDVLNQFVAAADSWWKSKGFTPKVSVFTVEDMTQPRWLALSRAIAAIKDFTGVSSRTTVTGAVIVGNKGKVTISLGRGVTRGDDPATVVVKAVDSENQVLNQPLILRGFDITKPAALTKMVQQQVDDLVKLIDKKIPDSSALDMKAMVRNLQAQETSGREINWQIREYQGKIYADWDITFRRNTKTGAFMENKTDIGRANAAMTRMQAMLENAGYKVETFIVTLDDVRNMDAVSDEAYSEYEQSFGSSIKAYK